MPSGPTPCASSCSRWPSPRRLNGGTLCILGPGYFAAPIPVTSEVDRLFLAGEFVDSQFQTPTMEKANQTGKLYAAAILNAPRLLYDRNRVVPPAYPLEALWRLDNWLVRG